MTALGPILTRLGLDQYHEALAAEGFETWETVLDIQESDLDALNFKLGHRRKLQREIANWRGVSNERSFGSPAQEGGYETTKAGEGATTPTAGERSVLCGTEAKRKYRRHPKPDENAPERPPSAYVIFSNRIREDVRGQHLSFTDIAKLVGDKWQKLTSTERGPFEAQAVIAKERYSVELSAYKKTDAYKDYVQYLADFKAKQGESASEGKRPKLEERSSGGSVSTRTTEVPEMVVLASQGRVESLSSVGSAPLQGTYPPPSPVSLDTATAIPNQLMSTTSARITSIPAYRDLPSPSLQRESRFRTPLSSRSPVSDDSNYFRGDQIDPIPRTARLSLNTGSHTPTLLSSAPVPARISGLSNLLSRSTGYAPSLQPQDSSMPSFPNPSTLSSGYTSASSNTVTSPMEESWRQQFPEAGTLNYNDLMRTIHLPSAQPVTSFGTIPLPPGISQGRPSDARQEQNPRTLPLPRPSAAQGPQHQMGNPPQMRLHSWSRTLDRERSRTPLGRSESEAVNTLAVLAYGAPKNDAGRHSSPHAP